LRGDLDSSDKHFTLGLSVFDDPGFRQFPGLAVSAFGFSSWNACTMGRADVAHQRQLQMMETVNRENPFDLAFSDHFVAGLCIFMREYEEAETAASRALALSEKYRFSNRAAWSRCFLGYAKAQLGNATEGIELIRQGIASLLTAGARFGIVYCLALLAAAQEISGSLTDAVDAVRQALVANPDELVYRPEALRLRGELRFRQGNFELAEMDLRDSLALAQRINAGAWRRRSTISLSRFLAECGRRAEGRMMLAEIYDSSPESFDPADSRDAKSLLEDFGSDHIRNNGDHH
jgi:tetratricopeptide (TPR) repeat protein